jgi:hypothetical protein
MVMSLVSNDLGFAFNAHAVINCKFLMPFLLENMD